ncbi:glycosyltransferase [Vibrio hannami]|uniref:glycosyltransferase n=1 Tax=Vibrio hannami TaxID=2717094 RepID=UPI00240F2152|nr:glycosyltransferase [Vibrio hannami]MDG3088256.1 glycosyltransferase [Vibrio hannami]
MNDLVSVYITTKNRVDLLQRAVESVLSQSYKNIEIIVSDDGSTDDTHLYLSQIKNERIKIILGKESKGACAARNKAIKMSSGKYVTGLDDDDYFEFDRIEKFVKHWKLIEKSGLDNNAMSGLFDDEKYLVGEGKYKNTTRADKAFHHELVSENKIGNQIFTKKKYFVDSGLFDEELPAWQDWDMWIRISKNFGPLYNIHEKTYIVDAKHNSGRISSSKSKKIRLAYARLISKYHSNSDRKTKLALLEKLYEYPQVDVKTNEVFELIMNNRVKTVIKYFAKKSYHTIVCSN